MTPSSPQQLRDDFHKEFTYGVLLSASSDLSAGKDIRFRKDYHPDTIADYWLKVVESERRNNEAEFLVDLYEFRSHLNRPLSLGQRQPIEDIHKYNFFNSLIAQLQDKYNVSEESLREEMRKRSHRKDLEAISPILDKDNQG